MSPTFPKPAWLRPDSPASTFIFLGCLLLLIFLLLPRFGAKEDYRVASLDPTAKPFQLSAKNQLLDPLGERKLTSQDQSREPSELELVNEIRTRILTDHRLSGEAQKTIVVTNEEAVTLRGVAHSQAEKQEVGRLARAVTTRRINNELEVQ